MQKVGSLLKVDYAAHHLKENGGKIHTLDGGKYSFAFFSDTAIIPLMALINFDGIIIESTNAHFTFLQIQKIRSFFEFQLYLKPVFLFKTSPMFHATLESTTDGEIQDLENLSQAIQVTSMVYQNVDQISNKIEDLAYDRKLLFHTLSYLTSRKSKDIIPVIDRMANLGYSYPLVQFYLKDNPGALLNILGEGEQNGLLEGRFMDSIHVCHKCYNGFLLYREVCPKCNSAEIKEDELIHHFRCANIGPKSDYQDTSPISDVMVCPKCDHQLKHIGVDYDKPSVIYTCQQCTEKFQQYHVKAKCTNCHQDTDIQNLLKKEIKSYHLTSKGTEWVKNPLIWAEVKTNQIQIKGTVSQDVFKVMLKYEMSKRTARRNNVCAIHWGSLDKFVRNLGEERYVSIISEILSIVKASIQSFDLLYINGPVLYFTQLNMRPSQAKSIAERILYLIQHLIKDNLNINPEELVYQSLSMSQFETPEELLTELIS